MIRFILVALILFLFLILGLPILFIEWLIGLKWPQVKDRTSLAIVNWAFRLILFTCGTKITYLGEENVPKDQAVLYVGNHRSYFDILLTYPRVPRPTGYIAKKEMLRYPILRKWMQYLHCLFLDRSDIKQGLKTILEAVELLKSGISICVFPEGTRNKTDAVFLPFHAGSLKMAERSKAPIVPMAIVNAAEIFENHMPKIKKTEVIVEYGTPINTADLTKEELRSLSERVQAEISAMYNKNLSLINK